MYVVKVQRGKFNYDMQVYTEQGSCQTKMEKSYIHIGLFPIRPM